ncbi:MAG TPA: phosphoribosylglycinamide formyltransferase [bacterium]|nr:phosphoribosylglycinamide formyltransferase [bacterium]
MPDDRPRIAVLISGRGSNLVALWDATQRGELDAEIALVISSRADAPGLAWAMERQIPALPLNPRRYPSDDLYSEELCRFLDHHHIHLICLAGYLKQLPAAVVARYSGRILNIHPALLPKYGGKGMYGHRVHEAVLAAGDVETGPSVHVVTEHYDEGPVLAQERIRVLPEDTPESLAARVLEAEHRLYPRVVQEFLRTGASVKTPRIPGAQGSRLGTGPSSSWRPGSTSR